MKRSLLSTAAALFSLNGLGEPRYFGGGVTSLPPNKMKTGARKQQRASKKRKRKARSRL